MQFSRSVLTLWGLLFASLSLAQNASNETNKPGWSASINVGNTKNDFGNAQERSISLRRHTPLGSIAVEQLNLNRFGYSDSALALDAYPRLWQGAYANVRYQHAALPDLYPGKSWRAEVYQNVGGGWELAASRDHLGFTSNVKIEGAAIGKYWGNFYAQIRHQRVSSDGSVGRGDRLMIRYYDKGHADHYLEANLSSGRSDDFSSALLAGSRSNSRGITWHHFVTREWGFKVSASQANDSSSAGGRARTMGVGLAYRW